MPRNATGGYTLPAGNPVVTGTLISAGWANPTMADIQLALTDSLSRSGNGGMLAPFKVPDGSNINPSLSFVNEATSGLYRFGANDIRMAVGTTDRMRWLGAGTPPQIYDEVNDRWNDLGAGGVDWRHAPTIPAEVEQGVGYMTRGGQSTLMPASPITGQAVTFSDLDNDWSETNFLTLDGNGNTFTQGSQTTYDLDLKGAFAQFAYLDGQWQIVNFGRLSDAYGFDLDDYATLNLVNSKPNDNILINGGFDIWQRSESFQNPTTSSEYNSVDRWRFRRGANELGMEIEKNTAVPDVGAISSCKVGRISGDTGIADLVAGYQIESADIIPYAGQEMTLSIRIRVGSQFSSSAINITVVSGTGIDETISLFGSFPTGSTIAASDSTAIDTSLTTQWQTATVTFTLPVDCSELLIRFSNIPTGTAGSEDNYRLNWIKLEIGSVATPYQARPIAEEFALCQRYYEIIGGSDLTGFAFNNVNLIAAVNFAVAKRAAFTTTVLQTGTWLHSGSQRGDCVTYTVTPYEQGVTFDITSFTGSVTAGVPTTIRGHRIAIDSEIY